VPQKHHEQAASQLEKASKHHRVTAKHTSEGNHDKVAHYVQADHGHQIKANEHANKASKKYAEKTGSKKKEGKDKEMRETSNGHK
jgi:hypothetical protein